MRKIHFLRIRFLFLENVFYTQKGIHAQIDLREAGMYDFQLSVSPESLISCHFAYLGGGVVA